MADQPEPELRWAPREPAPKRRGRGVLITALVVAVVAIVVAFALFVLPMLMPTPAETSSPSPSATPSTSSTPQPSPSATPEPTEVQQTPPPVVDPDLDTFRGQVQTWLDDATTGLEFLADATTDDARNIIGPMMADAQRLSEVASPSSLTQDWEAKVATYSARLDALESSINGGADRSAAISDARSALVELRSLVGL